MSNTKHIKDTFWDGIPLYDIRFEDERNVYNYAHQKHLRIVRYKHVHLTDFLKVSESYWSMVHEYDIVESYVA